MIAMGVNQVIYDGEELINLTSDTVTEEDVVEGATFHDASGESKTGIMKVVDADWNVLANKPFYEKVEWTEYCNALGGAEIAFSYNTRLLCDYVGGRADKVLTPGATYKVNWDGTEYTVVAFLDGTVASLNGAVPVVAIGGPTYSFEEFPFYMRTHDEEGDIYLDAYAKTSDSKKHTFSIKEASVIGVKKIDEKFIPDTIARTEDIPTDCVKTVNNVVPDENGNIELESLKGDPGEPGYTPVKGTDYWTATDKAEIVADVLNELPTWTGGSY